MVEELKAVNWVLTGVPGFPGVKLQVVLSDGRRVDVGSHVRFPVETRIDAGKTEINLRITVQVDGSITGKII